MIIGIRGSELALKQADIAVEKLGLKNYNIKIIKTKGDRIREPLQKVGTGVFTKELDQALIKGKIDIAIHSLKDIPVENFPKELVIACIPKRDDPKDCLVGKLREGSVIGTDSVRRQYELDNLYKKLNLKFKSLRGNIKTRLKKLENGEYGAVVMAKSALDRLGLTKKINKIFSIKEMVPAAGQGAIAVVARKKDNFIFKKDKLYDCCILEREFIKGLGGCKKAVGAYCDWKDERFSLLGLIYRNNKRILVNFSGSEKEVKNKMRKWKAMYT